jgi:hypothetical protein
LTTKQYPQPCSFFYPNCVFRLVFFHRIDTSLALESMYSSVLTENSSKYWNSGCRVSNYYNEAIQMNVIANGCYSFSNNRSVDTFSYIYKDTFVPFDSSINLISRSDHSSNNTKFQLNVYLQANTSYVLVVTTSSANVTGTFSTLVSGPNNVRFNCISEYLYYFCQ